MSTRMEILEQWEACEETLKDEFALVEEKDECLENCKNLFRRLHNSMCRDQGIMPSESAKNYNVEL